MRLGHIIASVHKKKRHCDTSLRSKLGKHALACGAIYIRPACTINRLTHFVFDIVINVGDHSGEVIPVPIPNTEVKLSYVDDTGFVPGK